MINQSSEFNYFWPVQFQLFTIDFTFIANLENTVSVHCTTLLERLSEHRASTLTSPQMKLTKLPPPPSIH